jgi:MSHA biogenesis protein MshM
MYLRHFSLREAPFSITPDAAFFYPHEGAQAALNTLLVAIRSGEGFLKIVGEVGCGKTVLCRQLLHTLQCECVTAYIPNPDLGPKDLLLALAQELGIRLPQSATRHRLLDALYQCLLGHAAQGRSVVVCIDEAQVIPLRTVESLRLLSNLETEKRKLLQVVLFGQPELDERLAHASVRQLRQRITFQYRLSALTVKEVDHYLAHRLRVAGYRGSQLFAPSAVRRLHRATRGVPRLINIMAHKSLLLAFGEGLQQVLPRHVRGAAADTPVNVTTRWWLYGLAAALVAAAGFTMGWLR